MGSQLCKLVVPARVGFYRYETLYNDKFRLIFQMKQAVNPKEVGALDISVETAMQLFSAWQIPDINVGYYDLGNGPTVNMSDASVENVYAILSPLIVSGATTTTSSIATGSIADEFVHLGTLDVADWSDLVPAAEAANRDVLSAVAEDGSSQQKMILQSNVIQGAAPKFSWAAASSEGNNSHKCSHKLISEFIELARRHIERVFRSVRVVVPTAALLSREQIMGGSACLVDAEGRNMFVCHDGFADDAGHGLEAIFGQRAEIAFTRSRHSDDGTPHHITTVPLRGNGDFTVVGRVDQHGPWTCTNLAVWRLWILTEASDRKRAASGLFDKGAHLDKVSGKKAASNKASDKVSGKASDKVSGKVSGSERNKKDDKVPPPVPKNKRHQESQHTSARRSKRIARPRN